MAKKQQSLVVTAMLELQEAATTLKIHADVGKNLSPEECGRVAALIEAGEKKYGATIRAARAILEDGVSPEQT